MVSSTILGLELGSAKLGPTAKEIAKSTAITRFDITI
jgi:hypothetical protein